MTCWYTGKAANNRGIHVHTPWVHQAHHCCYWSHCNHQQPSLVQEHCSPSQEHSPAVLLALQVWGTMVTVHWAAITTFVYMYVCTCTQVFVQYLSNPLFLLVLEKPEEIQAMKHSLAMSKDACTTRYDWFTSRCKNSCHSDSNAMHCPARVELIHVNLCSVPCCMRGDCMAQRTSQSLQ